MGVNIYFLNSGLRFGFPRHYHRRTTTASFEELNNIHSFPLVNLQVLLIFVSLANRLLTYSYKNVFKA